MASQPVDPLSDAIRAVFTAEQAGLAASGTRPGVAEPGFQLPDVTLVDPMGDHHHSVQHDCRPARRSDALSRRGCPCCNLALRTYESELLPRLEVHNAVQIAASLQRPDGSLSVGTVTT